MGGIIGGVVGGLLFLCLIVFGIFGLVFVLRRRKNRSANDKSNPKQVNISSDSSNYQTNPHISKTNENNENNNNNIYQTNPHTENNKNKHNDNIYQTAPNMSSSVLYANHQHLASSENKTSTKDQYANHNDFISKPTTYANHNEAIEKKSIIYANVKQ